MGSPRTVPSHADMRRTSRQSPEDKNLSQNCGTGGVGIGSERTFHRTSADWLGIAACVAVAGLILALSWFKLGSLDTGYHLAYGRHFLDSWEIVGRDPDPFLYPETAVPFVNANWGSQVVMALIERAVGPSGLIALRITLIAAIFTCIALVLHFQTSSRKPKTEIRATSYELRAPQSSIVNHQSSISPWLAWTWLLAGITAYERFSMRPELFSYAAMSVMVVLLMRGQASRPQSRLVSSRFRLSSRSSCRGARSTPTIVAMGVLQLAWVNLHSYFLVGILLTAAWLVGHAIQRLLTRRNAERINNAEEPRASACAAIQDSRRMRLLAIALVVQVAVCLVNPWHYRGAVFPLATLQFLHGEDVMAGSTGDPSTSAWSEISEFQSPFSFHGQHINARTIHAYYVLLAVAAVGLIAMLIQGRFGPAIVIIIFFVMSVQMRRNVALFAMIATPLAVGAVASAFPWSAFDRPSSFWRFGVSALRRFLIAVTIGLAGWWIYGIADGRFYYVERRITREFGTGYSDRTFQRDAVQWLADQPGLEPRLFVDYFSSSNTLQWLPPRFKLFVDTNTFAYEDDTLKTAFKLGLGQTDHNRFFDQYGVNIILLHCGPDTQMLVRRLAADDGKWALVYFDRHSVIFVRRIVKHVPVITADPLSGKDLDPNEWIAALSGPASRPVSTNRLVSSRYYNALALGTWVNVPMSLGWSRPALVLLNEALELAPDYHEAWYYLGVCHGNLGNAAARTQAYNEAEQHWTSALACFQRVLDLMPDHQDAAKYLEATKQRLAMLQTARTNRP